MPLALTTPESATLVIAVVATCAGIAQAVGSAGSARKGGIILAGIVGASAVVAFALLAFVLPSDDAESDTRAFQSRVREICDDNRSLETRTNRDFAELRRMQNTVTAAYIDGWIDIATRFSYASRQLSDEMQELDPPSSRADQHQEAVVTWQRLVRLMDGAVEAARLASTPVEAASAINSASGGAQGDRLNTSRDALLRQLAGTGCDPSLPSSALAG